MNALKPPPAAAVTGTPSTGTTASSPVQTVGLRNRDLRLVRATPTDWPQIHDWAAGEGWNLGRGDASILTRTDPDAFAAGFVGERQSSAIGVVNWDDKLAFAGMLLVDPALRGIGLGMDTFTAAVGRAAGRTVAVDAPSTLHDRLQDMGFVAAWRIIHFAGPVPAARASTDPHVIAATEEHHRQMAALDAACFPAGRPGFVKDFVTAPDRQVLVYANANGRIYGYGVLRAGHRGLRIGPLYAQESYHAAAIFDGLCDLARQANAVTISVDAPEPNIAACAVAETRGLNYDSDSLRMYRLGPAGVRKIDLTRLYGLTAVGLA